jgi:uncharacterized protein YkwD
MKKKFIMLTLAFTFLMTNCSNDDSGTVTNPHLETEIPTESDPTTSSEQLSVMAKQMFDLINKTRAEGCICGGEKMPPVPKLTYNFLLQKAALTHSQDMAKNKFMAHTGSDGSTLGSRVNKVGYTYRAVAENVAAEQISVQEVMNSWLNSSGHCKNIMGSVYKEVGVAMVDNYWTQVFATKM